MNKECERAWAFVRDKHNNKIFHLMENGSGLTIMIVKTNGKTF